MLSSSDFPPLALDEKKKRKRQQDSGGQLRAARPMKRLFININQLKSVWGSGERAGSTAWAVNASDTSGAASDAR